MTCLDPIDRAAMDYVEGRTPERAGGRLDDCEIGSAVQVRPLPPAPPSSRRPAPASSRYPTDDELRIPEFLRREV